MAINASDASDDEELELRMTSMIDVVFLLLIFFIVTLKIPEDEAMIETYVPEAAGTGDVQAEKETKEEFKDIMLTLRKESGSGEVKTFVSGQRMRSAGQLANRLKMFRNINDEGRVVVECADDVPYADLIEAISVVQAVELPMAFGNLN